MKAIWEWLTAPFETTVLKLLVAGVSVAVVLGIVEGLGFPR